MATKTIKVSSTEQLTFTVPSPEYRIVLSNGVELVTNTLDVSKILKAYKEYLASQPVEVTPPVVIPPITGVKLISYKEYCGLSDIVGGSFKVEPGIYNETADHSNLKDCSFDLSSVVVQNSYQALRIHGGSVNVAYKGLTLKNIDGYQIECVRSGKTLYTGAAGSFIDRLSFDGLSVDGGGQVFHSDGDLLKGKVWGLLKSLSLTNAVIKNINYGDIVYVGAGMDAHFENVTFDNINPNQNNHNGVIRVHGNVIAKNVRATNYQGNLIRNWLYSIEGTKTTQASGCVGYRSRKYSLIELQMTPDLAANGAVPGNAEIFNNTAISMATSKDWDGQLVDLYNTGTEKVKSVVNIYNNLGADLIASQGRAIIPEEMTNKMFDPALTTITFSNNKYFGSTKEAIADTINFKSKVNGVGA